MLPPEILKKYKRRKESDSASVGSLAFSVAPEVFDVPKVRAVSAEEMALYEAVVGFYEGDAEQLSRRKFSEQEQRALIDHVNSRGFSFEEGEFRLVLTGARRCRQQVRSGNDFAEGASRARHISLNNYDFDELRREVSRLEAEIGPRAVEMLCPTLIRIIDETEHSGDEEYPGRHLGFAGVEGRTAWRYQCLRIMDRLLYVSPLAVSNEEMERHIFSEFKRLGLRLPVHVRERIAEGGGKVLTDVLKRNYAILSELISQDGRQLYGRTAYKGGVRGHVYCRAYEGSEERVMAFKTLLTIEESRELARELRRMHREIFADERGGFDEEYPLLSLLSALPHLRESARSHRFGICKVYYTDLMTIDYKVSEGRKHDLE